MAKSNTQQSLEQTAESSLSDLELVQAPGQDLACLTETSISRPDEAVTEASQSTVVSTESLSARKSNLPQMDELAAEHAANQAREETEKSTKREAVRRASLEKKQGNPETLDLESGTRELTSEVEQSSTMLDQVVSWLSSQLRRLVDAVLKNFESADEELDEVPHFINPSSETETDEEEVLESGRKPLKGNAKTKKSQPSRLQNSTSKAEGAWRINRGSNMSQNTYHKANQPKSTVTIVERNGAKEEDN